MTSVILIAPCSCVELGPGPQIGGDQGWIRVYSNVDGAMVYFDGAFACKVEGGSCTVPVFTTSAPIRQFTVEKSGYTTYTGSVTMPAKGQTIDLYATLSPIPTPVPPPRYGSLAVRSSPEGAAIYLNGNYRGTTPATIPSLEPGTYSLRLDMSGYQSAGDSVIITAGQEQTGYYTLSRIASPGTVVIYSTPPNAFVYMDGVMKGNTPLTLNNVAPSLHIVELDLSGYYDWKKSFTLGNGQYLTITASMTPLASATGWILASSSPAGAEVYVDSVLKGTTPATGDLTINAVPVGNHNVQFKLSGYQLYSTTATVSSDTYSQVSAVLEPVNKPAPNAGTLSISTAPAGAEIYIDDVFVGISPLILNDVAVGPHTVMAQMPGYTSATVPVSVVKGTAAPVTLSLSPVATATKAGNISVAVFICVTAVALGFLRIHRKT